MRFPVMLTKDNDKQVKELNDKIIKWMDMYFEEKEKRIEFEDKYKINKASLMSSNEQNEELKGVIREMKKRIKDKDKGIEVLKRMLEEKIMITKVKLNDKCYAKIIDYKKGDNIDCCKVLCNTEENAMKGFEGCSKCNIGKIQDKNDNFKYITYEEAMENDLIIEVKDEE